jgi:uncharacterized protein (DUF488 family)
MTVFTIGHSTRPLAELINLLTANSITKLVDVRSIPRSRHNPQFNSDTLPAALEAAGIGYIHMTGLGGLRRPQPDSPNTGWRSKSFKGYADYMLTEEFQASLAELMALAKTERVAVMCAEALPWRCHRSLMGDALTARGIEVEHIMGEKNQAHRMTEFARVSGETVIYPGE